MGGAIGVISAAGEGSSFWFTLDLVEATSPAAEPDVAFESANGEAVNARILVVDDVDSSREIVEAYLDGRGYRVDAVSSAIDAIQMLGAETFDLVLMDIQMPVMDGVAATKRIRSLPKPMSDVPILAMTGNVLPMQIKSFLDAGMNGLIAKPISRAKLDESVRRWGSRRGPPPPEPAPGAFPDGHGAIDEFVAVVGIERARKIANDFSRQLNGAFGPDCALAEARRQAHDLINCAGFLGLGAFVDACQAIECQPAADADSESSALGRIRVERDLAREILSGQLLPRLRDRVFWPTD
jgi:CheY-like chemotaxis protein